MTEAADDVRVAHAVERDGLVAKVLDERALKLRVGHPLQVRVERLDDDEARAALRRGRVARHVDLRVAPAPEAVEHVVAPVESTLLKLQLAHLESVFTAWAWSRVP